MQRRSLLLELLTKSKKASAIETLNNKTTCTEYSVSFPKANSLRISSFAREDRGLCKSSIIFYVPHKRAARAEVLTYVLAGEDSVFKQGFLEATTTQL